MKCSYGTFHISWVQVQVGRLGARRNRQSQRIIHQVGTAGLKDDNNFSFCDDIYFKNPR